MIRQATIEDAPDLIDAVAGAFRIPADAPRRAEIRKQLETYPGRWLVYETAGRVMGGAYLYPCDLHVGAATIRMASVGDVAIHPSAQGQGHGSKLMAALGPFVAQRGDIDFIRLGGLIEFYSRFGFARFSRRYVEFTLGTNAPAGASRVYEGEIAIAPEQAARVQRLTLDTVPADHAALINQFFSPYLGHERYVAGQALGERWLALAYVDGGRTLGLAYALQYDEGSEFEGPISVERFAYDLTHPAALTTLVAWLNNHALANGKKRITARLPWDPRIVAHLSTLPIRFKLAETLGGKGGNMVRLGSLRSLLQRLTPEFALRLENMPREIGRGTLVWRVDDQQATLTIDDSGLRVDDIPPPGDALTLSLSGVTLLKMVLGLSPYSSLGSLISTSRQPSPVEELLLASLFPARIANSGVWG